MSALFASTLLLWSGLALADPEGDWALAATRRALIAAEAPMTLGGADRSPLALALAAEGLAGPRLDPLLALTAPSLPGEQGFVFTAGGFLRVAVGDGRTQGLLGDAEPGLLSPRLGVSALALSPWWEVKAQAQGTLSVVLGAGVFVCVGLILASRRLGASGHAPPRAGPITLLRDSVLHAGAGLSAWGAVAVNLALAAVQVALLVLSFWALLPALGLHPPLAMLAVSGVIGLGSVAAVALPPSLGAGPAATSVFVLAFFGIGEADALGFAALSWLANSLPPLVLGIVPLWSRIGRLSDLTRREAPSEAMLKEPPTP